MRPRESHENEQGELLLPSTEKGSEIKVAQRQCQLYGTWQWTGITLVIAASIAIGYVAGQSGALGASKASHGLPVPPGSIHTKWEHNLTFTQKPSPESEAAWASIIPMGRGFVHHEKVAPFISNIAVFHQIHCLHAIVVAYYEALESEPLTNLTDIPDLEENTSTRIAPFHIRHCFDYIRQALMCAADTNLEVLNEKTHLTNGWGQPKQCRDYQRVFAWAEKYANSSDTGIVT